MYKAILILFALTFIVLAVVGLQTATEFWAEIGQRLAEFYFLFFAVSWLYTRPRSRNFMIGTFVVFMIIITVLDWLSWNPVIASLKMYTWIAPLVYCLIFVLLPAFVPKLLVARAVPDRVRTKLHAKAHAGVAAE